MRSQGSVKLVVACCLVSCMFNLLTYVMEDDMQEVQERVVIQGSRIEYAIYCDWCCGHGYESGNRGDIVDCHKCHGSGFKFHQIVEADNG